MTLLSLEHFIPAIEPFLGKRIGYVRLPGNFGDQMIEMGTIQLFGLMGIDWYIEDFSGACVADELVIAGGGNMGPLYGACLSIRRKALELGKPITVLPQSFNGPEDLGYHRIYVRERESLRYRPDALLAPDLALALAWEHRSLSEPTDTLGVWLRKDREAMYAERSQGDPVKCCKSVKEYLDLAGKYRHLVTDRLHFAIAGLLQGRNVTLLPNSYHKNRSMWETWLRELGCKWQDGPDSFLSPSTVSSRVRGDTFEGETSVAEAQIDAVRAAGSSGVLQIMVRNLRDEASVLRNAHIDREREVRELNARFAERDAQAMINAASAAAELAAMKGQLMATQAELSGLRRQNENEPGEHEERYSALKTQLAIAREIRQSATILDAKNDGGFVVSKQMAYHELVVRLRQMVIDSLPAEATVLVVSKGDSELLKLGGRAAWHFPRTDSGAYAGHHPPDSQAAISELEALRTKGADFLIFPATSFWWLEFYADLRLHLERHYPLALQQPQVACAFDLRTRNNQDNFPPVPVLPDATELRATCLNGNELLCALPSETELRIELAQTLSALGRSQEAHAVLLEGLKHGAACPRLLLELSRREQSLGNQALANRYAAEAMALAPDDFDLCFDLAGLAWEGGRLDEVERLLTGLIQRFPDNSKALGELVNLYCTQIESHSDRLDRKMVSRLVALLANPLHHRHVPANVHLRIAESLGSAGELGPAMKSLKAALRQLDFTSVTLQDMVLRLLRPAVSDRSLVPFGDFRALASFLTHMGNGFSSVQDSIKARTCYLLGAKASPETSASLFNLAFTTIAEGAPLAALECLSGVSRVYSEDASQILWPAQNGQPWPHSGFDLSGAFEALKPSHLAWPKITVITPSYNQAGYVEETVLSVLNQHYPELQYIVVDGSSSDGSIEVLRRYEGRLAKLIIEPDEGQTDAINKALRLSTGDLIIWTNSDDMLAPGALYMLALTYLEQQADVIAGFCLEHTQRRFNLVNLPAVSQATFNTTCLGEIFDYWLKGHYFYQPEVAFSRRILEKVGGELDKSLYYTMDYDFWLRCAEAGGRVAVVHWPVGLFRKHEAQKTANLDQTVIEQGTVRDRYIVPQPSFERKLDIRQRLARAFAQTTPKISVISTRASKIFSPDTARELRESFAGEGLNVTFYDTVDEQSVASADLVILLVHIYKERAALRKLREQGCDVPVIGWFWDNHHHVFENQRAAADLDVCIPGHAFAGSYLSSRDYVTAPPVPLCVTQWTAAEASRLFAQYGHQERSDDLYGGFVRYSMAGKRNVLIECLMEAGMNGVYFLEESAMHRYFGMPLDRRFEDWASHKVSLCLPLAGDLSQRLFDALLTGQVPIVSNDIYDLDTVIPTHIQTMLPIIRFDRYHPDEVAQAHALACESFNRNGAVGVLRRHHFALDHMFAPRVKSIISAAGEFVRGCQKT